MRLSQVNLIAFTAVGVRLLALMMFFYVFREMSRMVSLVLGVDSYDEWPVFVLFLLAFFMVGVWLWKSAINLAKKIVPREALIEPLSPCDFERPIYQLAFVLLGIYVVINGVSEFSYTAQIYFSLPDQYVAPDQAKRQQAAMVSAAMEVLIGLVLTFGAKGVDAVIYKIRYGGQ